MPGSDAASTQVRGRIAYLDWVLPPNRALGGGSSRDLNSFSFSLRDGESPYLRFSAFCRSLHVKKVLDAGDLFQQGTRAAILRTEVDRTRAIDHGMSVVRAWLDSVRRLDPGATCRVAGALNPNGFFVIAFEIEAGEQEANQRQHATDRPEDDVFSESTIDNIALVLAHLIRTAVNPDAATAGGLKQLDSKAEVPSGDRPIGGRELYEIPTTVLEPLRVRAKLPKLGAGKDQDKAFEAAAKALLSPRRLKALEQNMPEESPEVFGTRSAVVALASRIGEVLDDNLPYVGDSIDNRAHLEGGFTEDIVRRVSIAYNRSCLVHVGSFLAMILLPTIVAALWTGGNRAWGFDQAELALLSLSFFVSCLWRAAAVHGFARLVGEREQGGWLAALSEIAARRFFVAKGKLNGDTWSLGLITLVFWLHRDWAPIQADLSTPVNQTLSGVVMAFVWAMPAIGIGILSHTANHLSTISGANTDSGNALDVLAELDALVRQGRIYVSTFAPLILGSETPAAAELKARFENADLAIARARRRVTDAVEARNKRFVHASALTAALIAFVATMGPIAALRPDDVHVSNKPIEIMRAAFVTATPPGASSEGAAPALLHDAAYAGADSAADTCDPNQFLSKLDALEPPTPPDGKEYLDKPEELFAYTLGHMIRCQRAGFEELLRNTLVLQLDPTVAGYEQLRSLLERLVAGQDGYLRIPARVALDGAVLATGDASAEGAAPASGLIADVNALLAAGPAAVVPAALAFKREASAASLDEQLAALSGRELPVAVRTTVPDDAAAELAAQVRALAQSVAAAVEVRAALPDDAAAALKGDVEALVAATTGTVSVGTTLAPDAAEGLTREVKALVDAIEAAVSVRPTLSEAEAAAFSARVADLLARLDVALDIPLAFDPGSPEALIERLQRFIDEGVATAGEPVVPLEFAGGPGRAAGPLFPAIPPQCLPHRLARVYFDRSGRAIDRVTCVALGTDACSVGGAPGGAATDEALDALAGTVRGGFGHVLAPATKDQLLVVGFTDSTGDVGLNLAIARDRANSVADALGRRLDGVRLASIWRGEEVLGAEPSDGVLLDDPLSRRADVYYCPAE